MSWIMRAKPGDKVTMLPGSDDWWPAPGEQVPVHGEVYTIRDLIPEHDGVYLRFVEIVNSPRMYVDMFDELCFHHEAFRPVEPRKTDISVFTDMLKTADKPVEECV